MTEQEIIVVEKAGELWNEFHKLPVMNDNDRQEVCWMIHRIQDMVAARQVWCMYNNTLKAESE